MDKLYTRCIVLMIFGAGIRAESILNGSEDLKNDYKDLLVKFANNNFKNYGINVILSTRGCPICDKILGQLMNESSQSFLMLADTAESNYSVIEQNIEIVPHIGNYKFIAFLMEKVDQFSENFDKLRSRYAWNPRARHLIFTVEKPADEELETVFKECWSHRVLNVAVVIYNLNEAYTYNPYLRNVSGMREQVDDWSRLYYDKLRNMNGHLITVKYVPFSANNVAKWINEESIYKFFGVEYGYGQAFFDIVNATPGFVNLTNDKVPLYRNYTYRYNIWNKVSFRDVELWLNIMPSAITFGERVEESYPANRDDLRILVPRSGIKMRSLLEPYNNVTWTCVLVSLVTFTVYTRILYRFRGIVDNAILRTFGIFLGKNLAKREHGVLEKITFVIFTMSSMLLLSAYQGELYGVLATESRYPEISTMLELSQKIKSVHTYRTIAVYLRKYVPPGIEVVDFGTDYVEQMKIHRDVAYAFPNFAAGYTVKWTILSENGVPFYHLMKDYAVSDYVTLTVPYGSPYLDKLNRVVLFCKEGGFDQYWENEANLDALLSGTIVSNDAEERTLKKLSLNTQLTAFYIWGCGLLVSSLCFVAEIYFHKNTKTNFFTRQGKRLIKRVRETGSKGC